MSRCPGNNPWRLMQEPGTWYAVLPLEWVYMFDPCCKMGQLDMRVVDEGGSKGQNVKGTEDVVAQQDAQEQVRPWSWVP